MAYEVAIISDTEYLVFDNDGTPPYLGVAVCSTETKANQVKLALNS